MIEFNARSYTDLLRCFLTGGYSIVPASQALDAPAPAMFLRHDVDFSLIRAVAMAEAEHDLGVSSTYYVMLANDYYNAVSVPGRRLIRRLVELGHEVGLHWDSETYPDTRPAAVDQFNSEIGVLQSIVGVPVRTASQHRPASSEFLNFDDQIEIEAYSSKIRARYAYVSDSAMRWREKTPLDYLAVRRDVQFTAHPVWWFTDADTAEDKLREVVGEQHGSRDLVCRIHHTYESRLGDARGDGCAVPCQARLESGLSGQSGGACVLTETLAIAASYLPWTSSGNCLVGVQLNSTRG